MYVCVHTHVLAYTMVCVWKSEDKFRTLVLSFHHVSTKDRYQIFQRGCNHQLSFLIGLHWIIFSCPSDPISIWSLNTSPYHLPRTRAIFFTATPQYHTPKCNPNKKIQANTQFIYKCVHLNLLFGCHRLPFHYASSAVLWLHDFTVSCGVNIWRIYDNCFTQCPIQTTNKFHK